MQKRGDVNKNALKHKQTFNGSIEIQIVRALETQNDDSLRL